MNDIILNNGVKMPMLGFGTWFIDDDKAEAAVKAAVEIGYRHIDTAQAYFNEAGVGAGVRNCGVSRDSLFVVSKVAAEHKTYEAASRSIDETLEKMGLDYLDMMIIHSPQPWDEWRGEKRYFEENKAVWKALEDAYRAGKLRAIGISNFLIDDLESLLPSCDIKPMVKGVGAYRQYSDRTDSFLPKAEHCNGRLFSHCTWRGVEKQLYCFNGKEVRRFGSAALCQIHPAVGPCRAAEGFHSGTYA